MLSLLTTISNQLSSLKRLWLQWDGPEAQTAVESVDCFQTAPFLVDVGILNEYYFVPITFPIHHLTRYQLQGLWERHKGILKLAPNLIEARIELIPEEEPWPVPDETIDLPYLRRLYVSHPQVLGCLKAPALEGLATWVNQDDTADILLESFFERSPCPLRRLSLQGFPDAHTTTKMLQRVPSLTEFGITIHESEASEGITLLMSTLAVTGSTMVAPQLRSLFFGCEGESSFDYTVYLEMIKSRWRAEHSALKTAALATKGPGPDSATLHGLHALRREGLDLLVVKGDNARTEVNSWDYSPTWY